MKLWLLLVATFLVQEPISTGAVLLNAYQSHYNPWVIHALFCIATLSDIIAGYYLGIFIDKRFGQNRMLVWLKIKLEKFSHFVGKHGRLTALLVYGPYLFPLSGIFAPWLGISLAETIIFIFLGELIFWYLPLWLLVLGVKTFVANPLTSIFVIVVVSLLLVIVPHYVSKRKKVAR